MMKKIIPGLLCALLSTGCIRLLPDSSQATIERVDLMALQHKSNSMVQKRSSVKVFVPTASDILNSLRVAITHYKQDLKFMDYLADIEWKDNLLLLVQQRFMEVLASNTFKSVSLDSEKLRADYAVYSYIHKFEIEQKDDQIDAVIMVTLTISDTQNNKIIEQKIINTRQKVDHNTIVGYLVALDQAFLKTQLEFITWIETIAALNVKVQLPLNDNSAHQPRVVL